MCAQDEEIGWSFVQEFESKVTRARGHCAGLFLNGLSLNQCNPPFRHFKQVTCIILSTKFWPLSWIAKIKQCESPLNPFDLDCIDFKKLHTRVNYMIFKVILIIQK